MVLQCLNKILIFIQESCSKQHDTTKQCGKSARNYRSYEEFLPPPSSQGASLPESLSRNIPLGAAHSQATTVSFSAPLAPTMRFEDILEVVGGFSRFQLLTLCILCLPRAILPLHFLLHNFVSATPPHRCASQGGTAWPLEVSPPPLHDVGSCTVYDGNNSVPCTGGWTYDRSQFTSTTVTEVKPPCFLACPSSLHR